MATPSSTLPVPLLAVATEAQVLKYFSMIGPTILVYDWCLTIRSELTHVWSRSWGIIECLYMFSRYMPFIDTPIMLMYHFFLVDPSIEACHTALTAQVSMYVVGMTISGQIFMIRTWAVWERSKVVGFFLFIEAAVAFAVQMYLIFIYGNSLTFAQGYDLGGCFILSSSNIILLSLGLLLLTQFTYLILMVLKTYPTARSGGGISFLSNIILQDGVLFYVIIFVLTLLNVIFVLQPILSAIVAVPTRVCYSIIASRIILHIRDVNKRRNEDAFTSAAVGSLMFANVLNQIEVELQPIRISSGRFLDN